MQARKLGWLVAAASLYAPCAAAETIVVDDQVIVRESTIETPQRGLTMSAVEARFGAPQNRHPAVGKPPITRWDYPGFAVFFENDRVLHSVVAGG
jgi:hypothetical protein